MFITDSGRPPKKPVIPSQLGALREVDRWMAENGFHELTDAADVAWRLSIQTREIPDAENPKLMRCHVRLDLTTTLDGRLLVKSGTLDERRDERLLGLVAEAAIDLHMRPIEFEANHADAARQELMDRIPQLKARLRENALHEVKRELIGRWVDERGLFSHDIQE